MFDPFVITKYDMNIMLSPLHEWACLELKCGRLWKQKKLGEWEMNNHQCSTKPRLIIQVIKFKSMTWPSTYHLMVFSRLKMLILSLWNPIAHSWTHQHCVPPNKNVLNLIWCLDHRHKMHVSLKSPWSWLPTIGLPCWQF